MGDLDCSMCNSRKNVQYICSYCDEILCEGCIMVNGKICEECLKLFDYGFYEEYFICKICSSSINIHAHYITCNICVERTCIDCCDTFYNICITCKNKQGELIIEMDDLKINN